MSGFLETIVETEATRENFDEPSYLWRNQDVADAMRNGAISSGLQHFHLYGEKEGRRMRTPPSESCLTNATRYPGSGN